jgi:hypothetical protein
LPFSALLNAKEFLGSPHEVVVSLYPFDINGSQKRVELHIQCDIFEVFEMFEICDRNELKIIRRTATVASPKWNALYSTNMTAVHMYTISSMVIIANVCAVLSMISVAEIVTITNVSVQLDICPWIRGR